MISAPTICVYHFPCADGFGAAWAVWKRYGDTMRYVPAKYGDAPPAVTRDDTVLIVDFSFPPDVMRELAASCKLVFCLDHHKSAAGALQPLLDEGVVHGEFDMLRSGAGMAWDAFHAGQPSPSLICHVEDRDLWTFKLEGTREISAVIFSHPYDFKVWDTLADSLDTEAGWNEAFAQGAALLRKHDKDCAGFIEETKRRMVIGGHEVWVANVPGIFASDVAGALAEGNPFGATYFDDRDGTRRFSLRSRVGGIDVSEVAKLYGGGGHRGAAGFAGPTRGWEGE